MRKVCYDVDLLKIVFVVFVFCPSWFSFPGCAGFSLGGRGITSKCVQAYLQGRQRVQLRFEKIGSAAKAGK